MEQEITVGHSPNSPSARFGFLVLHICIWVVDK